jgi:hypothetical protein
MADFTSSPRSAVREWPNIADNLFAREALFRRPESRFDRMGRRPHNFAQKNRFASPCYHRRVESRRKHRQRRSLVDDRILERWVQAFGVAVGMHDTRRQELAAALAALADPNDLAALDATREAAVRYIVAASEFRGFRWALRQALEEEEIAALARRAGRSWDNLLANVDDPGAEMT